MADQSPAWAREIARQVLADVLPDRWVHTQGVAAQARAVGPVLGWDTDLIEVAAWLHDIGYAPALAVTGFHPLDGARYLRGQGAPDRLCRLVAHHTAASVEARARGLAEELASEFPPEVSPVADALTYADMTTGPTGARVTVEERLEEILRRYPASHVVHRSIVSARPRIVATVREVEERLAAHPR
jgi:putative nucleotidyltransferase with HDIG domain